MNATQGMNIIKAASEAHSWDVNLSEMARIWKGGCIIRAKFLDRIKNAYKENPALSSLLMDKGFAKDLVRPNCYCAAELYHLCCLLFSSLIAAKWSVRLLVVTDFVALPIFRVREYTVKQNCLHHRCRWRGTRSGSTSFGWRRTAASRCLAWRRA